MSNWNKLPLCDCMKMLLRESGYDNKLCFENMNNDYLLELENYIEEHLRNVAEDLKCSHSESYSKILIGKFHFLPGHRKLVLNFKKLFSFESELQRESVEPTLSKSVLFSMNFERVLEELKDLVKDAPAFSGLLREIIQSAVENYSKSPNNHRYSQFIKYFAMYLFLLCGRQSYELLCANLPLPAVSTICKLILFPPT